MPRGLGPQSDHIHSKLMFVFFPLGCLHACRQSKRKRTSWNLHSKIAYYRNFILIHSKQKIIFTVLNKNIKTLWATLTPFCQRQSITSKSSQNVQLIHFQCLLLLNREKKKEKKRKVRKKTNDEILRNTRREIHTFKPYKRNR